MHYYLRRGPHQHRQNGQHLRASRNDLESLLIEYCKMMCTCGKAVQVHSPTCRAYPTTPLVMRAGQALRKLSQLSEWLKIEKQNPLKTGSKS